MSTVQCRTLADVPLGRLRVCRAFPLAALLLTLAPLVALVAWACWRQPDAPVRGAWQALADLRRGNGFLLAFAAILWALVANDVRKAGRATGWLAAFGADGVFVKWRSYQNAHWGTDDVQVVQIPLECIHSARVLSRWWTTPDGRYGGGRSEPAVYVELTLAAQVDTRVLAQHLADERAGKPCGRNVRKGMWGDVPVSLEEGSVLRIRWRAWPRAARFVAELAALGVSSADARQDELDLHAHPTDAALRELARTGDLFGLVRTLRAHDRTLSLADAKARATALIVESRP